ncbi:MAG TPA: XRE family transcriptional regulator, partial [Actinophytocola sp.]|nr:XRE family transcriptional regulator [Actinophytocola sp.]
EDRVELAHEEVTRAWPRLRRWIDEDRESLRLHRDLTAAAAAWESAGRDPGALHRGAKLAAVRELARRDGWAVSSTALERAFLRAATDQEADQERTRRAGRLRRLVRFSLG